MVLLLAAVTMIFVNTTETVAVQEARMQVYTNARYALDMLENDLMGCLSFNPPQKQEPNSPPPPPGAIPIYQAFWMENGYLSTSGQLPSYNVGGGHSDKAGDRMSFRSTCAVGDMMQTCAVTYELIPGSMAIDQSGATVAGDSSHQETVRTKRAIFTLVRRIRGADPATPTIFDKIPTIKDKVTGALVQVQDTELCHYILSFNLEYYSNQQTYSQLEPSPFPSADPLGDGKGVNDIGPAPGPYRVPSIRVTMVIVDDASERQERTIQKVIWIPQG
jgi:hypothetical protein